MFCSNSPFNVCFTILGAFFETPRKPTDKKNDQNVEKN